MKALIESIKKKDFRQLYLLYGEEVYLKNKYKKILLNELIDPSDSMNLLRLEGKGIEPGKIISFAETMPFFAERRVVWMEDTGFFAKGNPGDALQGYLKEIPESSVLVFVESEVDKKTRFYKSVKEHGMAAEFARQTEATLENWILSRVKKENKRITKGALKLFLEQNGNDMELLENELEKLFCYSMNRSGIVEADVERMGTPKLENRIFEMIRAIGEKRQKRALDLYYDLLALKEAPLKILSLLGRQFQNLRVVAEYRGQGLDRDSIATKMKMQSFIVKNYISQAANFSGDSLRSALQDCMEYEEAVKTGRMTDRLAVELLIVRYSSKEEE